jgi:hypothetical protein
MQHYVLYKVYVRKLRENPNRQKCYPVKRGPNLEINDLYEFESKFREFVLPNRTV